MLSGVAPQLRLPSSPPAVETTTLKRAPLGPAAHLQKILPDGVGLLITVDYNEDEMPGPPFSVGDDEVQRLLGGVWQLEVLLEQDVVGECW